MVQLSDLILSPTDLVHMRRHVYINGQLKKFFHYVINVPNFTNENNTIAIAETKLYPTWRMDVTKPRIVRLCIVLVPGKIYLWQYKSIKLYWENIKDMVNILECIVEMRLDVTSIFLGGKKFRFNMMDRDETCKLDPTSRMNVMSLRINFMLDRTETRELFSDRTKICVWL